MCCQPPFPPYIVPTVWYPAAPACQCAWGCYYGCTCRRCHYQPLPVLTFTPSPVEAKIDRLLVLAENAEKERKRQAAVNKKRSHRW